MGSSLRLLVCLSLVLFALAFTVASAQDDHEGHDHGDHDGFLARDVEGEFERFQVFPGSETLCPTKIEHGEPTVNPDDPTGKSYILPHTSIKHDGVACEGTGVTLIMTVEEALKMPEVQETLSQSEIVAMSVPTVTNQTEAMYAFDKEARTCGTSVGLPAGAGYMLIHDMDTNVTLVPSVVLTMGSRYMAVFAPSDTAFIGCLFRAEHMDHDDGMESDTAGTTGGNATATTAVPTATTASGATATTTEDDGVCFSAAARVTLESGAAVPISTLRVGDRVAVGGGRFSDVFGFTHADADARSVFVQMTTESGATLSATPGHYVYASGALKAAGEVRVGDALERADGKDDVVVRVQEAVLPGLYNPQTVDGSIVVEGLRASTYTQTVEPAFAHAALAPLRAMFSFFGVAPLSLPYGANSAAGMLPSGEVLVQ